jgi:hypothetical protein
MVRFAQLGNFGPDHSTENELRKAIGAAGHQVECFQENQPRVFVDLADRIADFDVVLWTRTGWDPPVPHEEQRRLLAAAELRGVPTVGYHLDRWFGLHREDQTRTEPFFRCAWLFTADGGHQENFDALGINHHWLPPAVSEFECIPGTPRSQFASDLAFVGSHQHGYHAEWQHRPQLVKFLQRTYGDQIRFWPMVGQPAVRGADLRDLYASTKINVGDSCLAGDATHYWSDRIPETIGRGGFLIHPWVEGIDDQYADGKHLVTWPVGNWSDLTETIAYYLDNDEERRRVAAAGREHVIAHHTYTVRIVPSARDDRRLVIPVVWLKGERLCWDQHLLGRYLSGPQFTHHTDRAPGPDGAVVVVPAQYFDVSEVNRVIRDLPWALVILTSDEGSTFPHEGLEHPNMVLWVMTPRPDRHDGNRFLGEGVPEGTRQVLADCEQEAHDRPIDVFFAGQVTHERREAALAAMADLDDTLEVGVQRTDGFLQGMGREEYLQLLAATKIAPCPAGALTPDTFRLYEALEAGCVPIADDHTADPDYPIGYWNLVYGAVPFPTICDWADLDKEVAAILADWPWHSARCSSWWQQRKRTERLRLLADIESLTGRALPDLDGR